MRSTQRLKLFATKFVLFLIGVIILIFFVTPLLWTISISLKTVPELFSSKFILWPHEMQFANYRYIIENTNILVNIKNSIIISVFALIFVLIISLPAAYALSRLRFASKRIFLFVILIFQMLSPIIIVIPLYRLFLAIGIYNQLWSLVLIYGASFAPFTVWYLKGYFDTIPQVIDEAAHIDGASNLQTLWRIQIPMSMPGIASVSILLFVQCWSQFIIPLILLDDKNLFPVPVGLLDIQASSEAVTTHYLAAASIIGILPVLVAFIIFQKFIVGALTQGAVKE